MISVSEQDLSCDFGGSKGLLCSSLGFLVFLVIQENMWVLKIRS